MNVSLVILNYNKKRLLEGCLKSICGMKSDNIEIIVVDNGSFDGSAEFVQEKFPWVRTIVNSSNCGYALGNDIGAEAARGKYLIFMNNDTIVCDSNWVDFLTKHLENDESIGIIGPLIIDANSKRVDSFGGAITYPLGAAPAIKHGCPESKLSSSMDVAYVAGAALMIRKDLFERLGGFDPSYFAFHEEVDLCWRARATGFRVLCEPRSRILHIGSASWGSFSPMKEYLKERNRFVTNMKNYGPHDLLIWMTNEAIYAVSLTIGSFFTMKARKVLPYYFLAIFSFTKRIRSIVLNRKRCRASYAVSDAVVLSVHTNESVPSMLVSAFRRR